jgi:diguanylate cyclase (GGDEF)-like protein
MMKERDDSGTATIDRRGINAYRALRDLAGEVLVSDDVENALNRCGSLVQELLSADACSVALLDQRAGTLVPLLTMAGGRSADVPPLSLQMFDGRLLTAINERRTLIVAHGAIIDGDVPMPLTEAQSALTAMLIPLPVRDGMHGILWIGRIHGEPFNAEELDLAETIAAMVALAIRSLSTQRPRHDESRRDPRTGLLDAALFEERLDQQLRLGPPCALLLLDLDHFALFNARYGERAGDDLLMVTGRLLREGLRADDEGFRRAGDEMALLLPKLDRAQATAVAERLRATFARTVQPLCATLYPRRPEVEVPPLTLSIGLTLAPDDAAHPDPLVAFARDALRRAKRAGGNCVVNAHEE